ncbi:MAG: iron-containing alcohol dehydrogenase [Intestinimonas sp.]|jgi:alcohol dehydrogenase class IV|nr:iron-containing alcohol dehydrogenase [Intestinimonas sp.]
MEFQYHLPVNLLFGQGTSDRIGEKCAALGRRALIVTGGSSTKRSGLLAKTETLLHENGVSSVLFDRVVPNPLTTTVYEGADLAKSENCDLVVALGGGSSIDVAKGIAFQMVNGGDISEYIFGRKSSDKALPVVAVPTTCGTGSEGNGFAVLTNPETKGKKSLRSSAIIPACSIIDPLLMTTLPKRTLAAVGFDALCHNMEAYLSALSQPITAMQALEGTALAAANLRRVYADPSDLDGWEGLCLASTLGGMVIGVSGVTAPHGLEHPASGLKNNLAHGEGLAALTVAVTRHTLPAGEEKYEVLAKRIGGALSTDIVDEIARLLDEIGLNVRLGDYGITSDDVPWMAESCRKLSVGGLRAHPRFFRQAELEQIYSECL